MGMRQVVCLLCCRIGLAGGHFKLARRCFRDVVITSRRAEGRLLGAAEDVGKKRRRTRRDEGGEEVAECCACLSRLLASTARFRASTRPGGPSALQV
ncbi:hypothetical protein F4802DRAFT_564062, partial [Xylaria palmicola]